MVCSCSLLLLGQDNTQNGQAGSGPTVRTPLQINVTGCLKKNAATGGYYVADKNGRTWELSSKKVTLAKQVFHTVSVSGHPSASPTTQEDKSEAGRKPESDSRQFTLDVTELEVLSPSCTR